MVFRYVVGLNWPQGGGPGVNVWHFRDTGTVDVQNMVNKIKDFYELVKPHYQQGLTAVGPSEALNHIETESPEYHPVTGWTVTSTGTGVVAPTVLQCVVGWRTTVATRSGRGRTFIGPLDADAIDATGTPSSTLIAALNAAGQLIVDYNAGIGDGAIGVWSPTDGVIRDIVGKSVKDKFAVLRSRRD